MIRGALSKFWQHERSTWAFGSSVVIYNVLGVVTIAFSLGENAGPSYYSTVAQVVPVFLIAVLVEVGTTLSVYMKWNTVLEEQADLRQSARRLNAKTEASAIGDSVESKKLVASTQAEIDSNQAKAVRLRAKLDDTLNQFEVIVFNTFFFLGVSEVASLLAVAQNWTGGLIFYVATAPVLAAFPQLFTLFSIRFDLARGSDPDPEDSDPEAPANT